MRAVLPKELTLKGVAYRFVVMQNDFKVESEPDLLALPTVESHLNLTIKALTRTRFLSLLYRHTNASVGPPGMSTSNS